MALPLVEVQTAQFRAKPIDTAADRVERARIARSGMRNKRAERGHCIGSTRDSSSGEIHVVGSIVAQLEQGLDLERGLDEEFIRYRKIAGRGSRNVIFVVDTSGSMLSSERLALVKGCVVSLLQDAYVKRTRVAIVGFGGLGARLVLPFTSSPEMAARRIDGMKGGGGTPMLGALAIAARLVQGLDGEPAQVILLSDGRYDRGSYEAAARRIRSFGLFCKRNHVPVHLVDAGSGRKTAKRRVALLADMLQADVRMLEELRIVVP